MATSLKTTPCQPEWIDLPGGWFSMGGPGHNEGPAHRVWVSPFRLARFQVRRREYQQFLNATGREPAPFWDEPAFSHPDMPAVGVSWDDAVAYCAWLSAALGEAVRLPTEAEWECAAKAGREVPYPWGDDPPESLPDFGERWGEGPEPVDAYPSRHPLGLVGMGENVHEWCADWLDNGYYAVSTERDPRGPATGKRRASRGGSWRHAVPVTRCAARSSIPPHMRLSDYGFRLAASLTT